MFRRKQWSSVMILLWALLGGGLWLPHSGAAQSAHTPNAPALTPTLGSTRTPTLTPTVPCRAVAWTARVNTGVSVNSLIKTSPLNSWNAGGISIQTLTAGSGYVQANIASMNDYVMFGLSHGNTNTAYADIDFAIYTYPVDGKLRIYEAGVGKGIVGTYAVGDVLRVAVANGVVRYYRNGALLYTSQAAPVYPLLLDSAIYNPNGQVQTAYICGTSILNAPTATVTPTPAGGMTGTATRTPTPTPAGGMTGTATRTRTPTPTPAGGVTGTATRTPTPAPLYPDLHVVSAVSSSEAWAGGNGGSLLHYTNGTWQAVDLPALQGLNITSLHMRSATDGWLATSDGKAFEYNGSTWVEHSTGLSALYGTLHSVWPAGPHNAWTYKGGTLLHWDGTQWNNTGMHAFDFHDIAVSAAGEGWAVGYNDYPPPNPPTIYQFAGAPCAGVSVPPGATSLYNVWPGGLCEFWVAGTGTDAGGSGARVYHFQNGAWTAAPVPASFTSFYMQDASHGWATTGGNAILHWDGVAWTTEYQANGPLFGVGGVPGQVWAVGFAGTIRSRTGNGPWGP